jgi:hypothetical protein
MTTLPGTAGPPGPPLLRPAFNLMHVPALDGLANEFSVALQALVTPPPDAPGPLRFILIENFMIDVGWLMSACPDMFGATEGGVVVYGDSPDANAALLPKTYSYSRPETLPFGTHHTKMVIAFFDAAVRGECGPLWEVGEGGGGLCFPSCVLPTPALRGVPSTQHPRPLRPRHDHRRSSSSSSARTPTLRSDHHDSQFR